MHGQTGKVSKGMEAKRIFKMVQVKNTVTGMKDFISMGSSLHWIWPVKEKQTKKIEYAGTVGQYQKA